MTKYKNLQKQLENELEQLIQGESLIAQRKAEIEALLSEIRSITMRPKTGKHDFKIRTEKKICPYQKAS